MIELSLPYNLRLGVSIDNVDYPNATHIVLRIPGKVSPS
jgi:hypothetical protein